MKAIIPAAGLGTRMLPITKTIPKELLPIIDRPLVEYILYEAKRANIDEIIIITSREKQTIKKHLEPDQILECQLKQTNKTELLNKLKNITPQDLTITEVTQNAPLGLAHAIYTAKSAINNNPFVVLLPDVLISEYYCDLTKYNLSEMIENYYRTGNSQIMVQPVPSEFISQYGIVGCNENLLNLEGTAPITSIIEKPSIQNAPSNLAIVGRYVFSEAIWPLLENLKPDKRNEYQLTDAIVKLLTIEKISAYKIVGKCYDCGSKLGYLHAIIDYGINDPETQCFFKNTIEKLI